MQDGFINHTKLLLGFHEAERLPECFSGRSAVPDYAYSILNQEGLLYRPVVDERFIASSHRKPTWPEGKPFAVCLSHDVDSVTQHSVFQVLRKRSVMLRSTGTMEEKLVSIFGGFSDLAKCLAGSGRNDPHHCMEKWLQVEEETGATSTFFFWPGFSALTVHHYSDCSYDLDDTIVFDAQRCSVAEMMQDISRRGWEIGLHPSWHTFSNPDELKRQKEALEKAVGHDIVSVRQHFLHYDIRITPAVQSESGFLYDTTLGFNDNVGFRFGTCYPWHLYDQKNKRILPILEVPLIIQDGAMLLGHKGMRLDSGMAYRYVQQITEEVMKLGGVLSLVWHPHYQANADWWNLYLLTLEYIKQKNPWFATVRQVGEWFKKENSEILCRYSKGFE